MINMSWLAACFPRSHHDDDYSTKMPIQRHELSAVEKEWAREDEVMGQAMYSFDKDILTPFCRTENIDKNKFTINYISIDKRVISIMVDSTKKYDSEEEIDKFHEYLDYLDRMLKHKTIQLDIENEKATFSLEYVSYDVPFFSDTKRHNDYEMSKYIKLL